MSSTNPNNKQAIPKGLQEVLDNPKHSVAEKVECIKYWTYRMQNLDTGEYEPPRLTKQQAKELIKAL